MTDQEFSNAARKITDKIERSSYTIVVVFIVITAAIAAFSAF